MSTGFNFGSANNNMTSTPAFGQTAFGGQPSGSITFGTPVSASMGSTGFGQPATGSVGNTSFGQPVTGGVGNTSFGQPVTGGFGAANFSGFGTAASPSQNPLNSTLINTQSVGAGFGFGSTPASSTTGFGFGTAPATSSTGFGFGSQQTVATAQPTGFGLTGQPATSTAGFGLGSQPTTSATGFGFGSTPAATVPSFGFGASVTSTGAGLSFGTTPVPTGTALSFGTAPAAAATGLSFGATAAPTGAGFPFGGAASSAPSYNLGAPTPASTGMNFAAPASTGLSFGTPATSTTFSLGGTLTAPSTGMTFAAPISSAGLSFGSAVPSTGFSLTQPQTTTTGLIGSTSIPGGLSFGGGTTPSLGINFGSSTTTTAPTLSFGTPASTSTSIGGTGFGFGAIKSTLSFGLGGGSTNLTVSKPPTTASPNVGLGGIIQSTPKTGTTAGKTEVLPRDQPLPNELSQTVDSFKSFVKQQKGFSSDVARCSVKEFKKVATEIDLVSNILNEVETQLQTNRAVAEKLKLDTATGLQHIEMAQRTFDTPPGLQYENSTPMEFFNGLIDNFEREMHTLKMQIENTDKYVKNLGKPATLTSQDLAMGMRRLHESFVALAGRLQSVHSQVESQKEQYLNLRKYMLHDDCNVFESPKPQAEVLNLALNSINYKPPAVASGPTPFSSLAHPSVIQAAVQNQSQQTAGFGTIQTQTNLFGSQSGPSLFGNPSIGTNFGQQQSSFFNSNSGFQLQKPPTGNKRSK